MLRAVTLISSVLLTSTALAASDQTVSRAENYDDFSQKFCSANRDAEHIFILPVSVFTQHESVKCDDGESKLRTSEPETDPGHVVLNIDPPHGSQSSFDCDGKADIDMTTVGINCLSVSQESKEHPKE